MGNAGNKSGTMSSKNLLSIAASCLCASGIAHAGQTINYTYDALGRLTEVQSQGGSDGTTQVFHFDAAGNRTQYQVLTPVALSMNSTIVNLTPSGATLTVTVSDPSATGTVTFTENGTVLGSASVANGEASITLQGYGKGSHAIAASYSGSGADSAQTTTFTIRVQDLSWLPAVLKLLLQN